MGNVLSEEEENEVLEEAYALSLDSPDVDKKVNSGTTAANCQPKHTLEDNDNDDNTEAMKPNSHKHARESSVGSSNDGGGEGGASSHRGKRLHHSNSSEISEQEKKLSYFQMARLGYQELVNAIIRPPRAEYKVRNEWGLLL